MNYNEIDGDLIVLAKEGKFDVIGHGCNCKSNMGAGIAPQMARAFGCDKFEMEIWGDTIQKLGNVDFKTFVLGKNTMLKLTDADFKFNEPELTVCNLYTQYGYGRNFKNGSSIPLDYEALTLCMRKMNMLFKGKHIGLPKIGSGLAKGNWEKIKSIIQTELSDCKVTIVNYKP
jgi:O-acetyl-ADP-ribose deacetylase (regulator of RNase III)